MDVSAAEIFDRQHLRVYRYFRRLVGAADLAEDLTQEVFLRVVRGLDRYQAQGREAAWVFRIARNVLLDHRRARAAAPETSGDIDTVTILPDHVLAFDMREALGLLSPTDRHVYVLREVVGLSYGEIAEVCELTQDAVRARLRRARIELRARLRGRLDGVRARDAGEA
jgi:RNA polymerase sigma-70 factor (ECF subfamily)